MRAVLLGLADREERIPDRPGVDAALGEGGARIRRRQVDRRDVGVGEAGLLQRCTTRLWALDPLVKPMRLPLRSASVRIGESFGTRMPWPLVIGWPAA